MSFIINEVLQESSINLQIRFVAQILYVLRVKTYWSIIYLYACLQK